MQDNIEQETQEQPDSSGMPPLSVDEALLLMNHMIEMVRHEYAIFLFWYERGFFVRAAVNDIMSNMGQAKEYMRRITDSNDESRILTASNQPVESWPRKHISQHQSFTCSKALLEEMRAGMQKILANNEFLKHIESTQAEISGN